MGLSLVVGPAHAGKVALLLDRFVDALDRDPWLIVPNRVDVDRVERELAGRGGALLAGTVGTFDTLFAFLAGSGPSPRVLGDAERTVVLRHIVGSSRLDALGPSSRFAGFTDSLAGALTEIEAGLLDPEDLGPDLAGLARAYRAELERLGVRDRGMVRRSCGRAADDRSRLLERRPGVRVRLRGSDGRRVAADRGARGAG